MNGVRYRLVVDGELSPRYAPLFEGMTLDAHDGRTEIVGVVEDQSQLQGLLARIANNGLELISVSPEAAADVENRGA
jgi:hypothetical protein